jgi:competence protein ComEC
MPFNPPVFVKQIPILRMLLSMCLGIILQYNTPLNASIFGCMVVAGLIVVVAFGFIKFANQFTLYYLQGFAIIICFIGFGGLLSYYNNDLNNKNSFVNTYKQEPIIVQLLEDVASKPKSYKANAKIVAKFLNNQWIPANGKTIIYTKKDSAFSNLKMGNAFVVRKPLTRVVNSGNPGGYNYARFCSFQGIYHQIYLTEKDVEQQCSLPVNRFTTFIYSIQQWVLHILKKYIKDDDALSIAEALLISYREDLDKDLVKAYSNTGVVHIIAISGMHLGMIYWMLVLLFKAFKQTTRLKIIRAIVVIIVLWLFSAVAGLTPSIVRSAIMFSFIAIGDGFNKKSSIYNSLALSAFIILLFQPFALWDVGFQLSYAAVLSIALFNGRIKRWFYFKNKLLQGFFNLNAVTLSAQVLTLPIVLYHFHQFPTYFLLTNLIAVPISSIVLFAEIALLIVGNFEPIANWLGNGINNTILWLNDFILGADSLPFASIQNIYVSIFQACILMLAIIVICYALMLKKTKKLLLGLSFFALFLGVRMYDIIQKKQQKKIVIYNVPLFTGIDFIDGKNYTFWGDSTLQQTGFLQNFHIKPSRILHRLSNEVMIDGLNFTNNIFTFNHKKILVIDKYWQNSETPINVDFVLVTQNPKLYINQLKNINTKLFVFDGSNPMWKIELWQKDCINLHLPHHITALQGAYEINCK